MSVPALVIPLTDVYLTAPQTNEVTDMHLLRVHYYANAFEGHEYGTGQPTKPRFGVTSTWVCYRHHSKDFKLPALPVKAAATY